MSTLTAAQIAQVAAGAGFRGDALVRAVAVALAESGGNTAAVGVNSDQWRSRDRGLWQINDHWHPTVTDAQAFSPSGNAAAAYSISSGGKNWSPWSTWKNGAAVAQLGRARMAVAAAPAAPPAVSPTGSTTAVVPVGRGRDGDLSPGDFVLPFSPGGALGVPLPESLEKLNDPVAAAKAGLAMAAHAAAWISDPHNWARVAMVSGGTVAVLLGVGMLARSGAAGSTAASVAAMPAKAAKTAASVIPVGKVATAAKAAATAGK